MIYRSNSQSPWEDRRQRMIDETSAFLTWALKYDLPLPQIPTRQVSEGGFGQMMKNSGARAAATHWWLRAVHLTGAIYNQFSGQ
ncbi:MAG: hypothetical protein GC162_10115 [Planctomycetes bacterium]|nr:hypothetical protein [Planctomycetota bacterium]